MLLVPILTTLNSVPRMCTHEDLGWLCNVKIECPKASAWNSLNVIYTHLIYRHITIHVIAVRTVGCPQRKNRVFLKATYGPASNVIHTYYIYTHVQTCNGNQNHRMAAT